MVELVMMVKGMTELLLSSVIGAFLESCSLMRRMYYEDSWLTVGLVLKILSRLSHQVNLC